MSPHCGRCASGIIDGEPRGCIRLVVDPGGAGRLCGKAVAVGYVQCREHAREYLKLFEDDEDASFEGATP